MNKIKYFEDYWYEPPKKYEDDEFFIQTLNDMEKDRWALSKGKCQTGKLNYMQYDQDRFKIRREYNIIKSPMEKSIDIYKASVDNYDFDLDVDPEKVKAAFNKIHYEYKQSDKVDAEYQAKRKEEQKDNVKEEIRKRIERTAKKYNL